MAKIFGHTNESAETALTRIARGLAHKLNNVKKLLGQYKGRQRKTTSHPHVVVARDRNRVNYGLDDN